MSWYVSFYIGLQDKEGKIYPLGPFNNKGEYKCVHYTSRSFTTDLKDCFDQIKEEMVSDELKKEFPYCCETDFSSYFGYVPVSQLPTGDWVKSGYYLLEDIQQYMAYKNKENNYFEGFFYNLSPTEYAMKLENELKFGKPEPKKDFEGNELACYSCADYSYFSYPDYNCKEYEAHLLSTVADILLPHYDVPDGSQVVVIKTEG